MCVFVIFCHASFVKKGSFKLSISICDLKYFRYQVIFSFLNMFFLIIEQIQTYGVIELL